MNRYHIILYHAVYWIYRVIHILTYAYFVYGESWYRGAYVVQLVLMPFFYSNYAWLIPALIKKKHKKFILGSIIWTGAFVWTYSRWTIHQRNLLYGEELWLPDYVETFDNLIYIWLISAGFCLFEFWVRNLKKNQELALEKKNYLLQSEENIMLNCLLSDYLNSLDKKDPEKLPDKILLLSDFFKYILYNRDKAVTLKTEITYLQIFDELTNSNVAKANIQYGYIVNNLLIRSSQLISAVHRLINLLYINEVLDINIECGKYNEVLISVAIPNIEFQIETMAKEFSDNRVRIDSAKNRFTISIDAHLTNFPIPKTV